MQNREHVNGNGKVPTINEVAAYAMRVGYHPRIMKAPIKGAANILFATGSVARKTQFRSDLEQMGWPFVHTIAERSFEQDSFAVLVTL